MEGKGGLHLATKNACNYPQGPLPACAPLALSMIPTQQSHLPAYDPEEALAKGTLFPGLDLPFMNYVAKGPVQRTPLTELMALDFVTHELTLYLDTHADDREAFRAWKGFVALSEEAHRRYTELFGPVMVKDTAECNDWAWINEPWPWDQNLGRGGNR